MMNNSSNNNNSYYMDCDYIEYEYTKEFIEKYHPKFNGCCHPKLNDYKSLCNSGLWRDGSFGNALIALKYGKVTDKLNVYKNGKCILEITRDTPKELYLRKAG